MKTTFLINKTQTDGSLRLECGTIEELHEILEANKCLPPEQRRYFIKDYIHDGMEYDCIIMEAPYEMYQQNNREHTSSERTRKANQMYDLISLNALLPGEDGITVEDTVADPYSGEETVVSALYMEELRKALSAWQPWATEMLKLYLSGRKKDCTEYLAAKYQVSEQAIRKYKRQFEKYFRNFHTGVSF